MATKAVYEPSARFFHTAFSIDRRVYVWGARGRTDDFESGFELELANSIELFNPFLEVWRKLKTTAGTPHPGLAGAACVSFGENVYMYGGHNGKRYEGALSCLNVMSLTWSLLCPEEVAGAPMRKDGCGIVMFHGDKLAVIGGTGYPTGPAQARSKFIKYTGANDGIGWTNEFHVINIGQGLWSSPLLGGTRPPPCAAFTLTSIDSHRAVLFAGYQPGHGRVNDLYIIDFDIMEITKIEPRDGEPWPVGRSTHAACCLGFAGDHIHLLVTGGKDNDNKALNDMWFFNVSLKKWTEVTLPDGTPPRWSHSTTAISLGHGLIDVTMFGGTPDNFFAGQLGKDYSRISETTVITFEQRGSELVMMGVANNSQRGTIERIREKMLKISERSTAVSGDRADTHQLQEALAISQANERTLRERMEECEVTMREERERAQEAERRAVQVEERSHDLEEECERRIAEAEVMVREERQIAQEAERRAVQTQERSHDLEDTLRKEREECERRIAEAEAMVREERQRASERLREVEQQTAARIQESERRRREAEQQAVARERAAEVRVQEAQQQSQQRVEQIEQEMEEQIHQAEERARSAERRSHDLQQRSHDAEQRAQDTEQSANQRSRNAEQRALSAEQRSHDLQQRSHDAEQQNTALERRLHEMEQRARESERRARQAEALVQQSHQESHWAVQRREIELTKEEMGKGGWAAVKVANFRGTRVAAKCFYQEILVSRYNRQLFNREMNMAARLRHPNLVQFIGASLEGEPIILTELMTTSLRAVLERGPIVHAHITSISMDVARGVNYLHLMQPHPIIHRDISSANVLLDPLPDNRWKAKISDYGSVNLVRELRTVGPGSPVYAAPEANLPAHQSPKMDIFSFGVLLIEMLTDQFPLVDARQRLIDSIDNAGFLDLIRRCLNEERDERPSANEIIAEISGM